MKKIIDVALMFCGVVTLMGMPTEEVFALGKYAGNTTAVERAQLPKYCYAQYIDDALWNNPQYSIQGCGGLMNHLCPGLIHLMRSKSSKFKKFERVQFVERAIEDFKYTLNGMIPGCGLRGDVENAMVDAQATERGLKGGLGRMPPTSPEVSSERRRARNSEQEGGATSGVAPSLRQPESQNQREPNQPAGGENKIEELAKENEPVSIETKVEKGCRYCPPTEIQRKWEDSFKGGGAKP